MQIVPKDFVIFPKNKHQTACIKCNEKAYRPHIHYFPTVHIQRSPNRNFVRKK